MVTKWSRLCGEINVSADQADSTNISDHAVKAGSDATASSGPTGEAHVEAPNLAPEHGASAEPVAAAAPTPEQPKAEAPKPEAPKASAPREPGKIMVMSPARGETWNDERIDREEPQAQKAGVFGKRRVAALTAVVALAAIFGAVGGAVATAGLGYLSRSAAPAPTIESNVFEETVQRLETELAALKGSVEASAKAGASQTGKLADRIEKVEKAQAEPLARIAKLSDSVEKLRSAPPPAAPAAVAAAPAAPRETTASVPQAAAAPKPEVNRLPTVNGWVLREVADGGAVISGRTGTYEVYAGDPIPGLGRVDAIRKQDGRWVVVTSRGLIVER